jgi:peroxiredoxin
MKNRVSGFFMIISLSALGLFLGSCKPKVPKEINDVFLHVNFTNTQGLSWIYLKELNVHDLKVVDSFDVRKTGRRTFRFSISSPGFYIVQTRQYDFITLLLEPGERAELFADGKKMKKAYQIKGSPGSSILQEYFRHTEANLQKTDSLRKVFLKIKDNNDFPRKKNALDSAYNKILMEQRNFVISLAKVNHKSISSVFIINQRFGPDLVVKEKTDFPLFKEIDSCLMSIYPDNKHVIDHHRRVSEVTREHAEYQLAEERLKPGKPAPEVKLHDQNGKELLSTDFIGKTVLLYFWSATTGKARQDHALMQPFYVANKSKGLEIISISVDENKELWKAALKIDKLPWVTVSEPGGFNSPVARLFALHEGLPYYYVIDKQGNMAGQGRNFTEAKNILTRLLIL